MNLLILLRVASVFIILISPILVADHGHCARQISTLAMLFIIFYLILHFYVQIIPFSAMQFYMKTQIDVASEYL